jgi:N-acetylmuramic acid 6-phosphate etherase
MTTTSEPFTPPPGHAAAARAGTAEPLPPTERPNPASTGIDRLDVAALLELINAEDTLVPAAVHASLPALRDLVEAGEQALAGGGRVHYFGAGASGRLAVGDAAELLPTYGVGPESVRAHLAGGPEAAARADESAEDSREAGIAAADELTAHDLAIGLTASGRTPYVAGALARARAVGAVSALISCNPTAPLAALADINVVLDTGPEVITGSTRMKAGSAQKMALHTFSTALMVRTGRTWSNLMVSASANNAKLNARAIRTLAAAAQVQPATAESCLDQCDGETPTALVALLTGACPNTARRALATVGGRPAAAIDLIDAAGSRQ